MDSSNMNALTTESLKEFYKPEKIKGIALENRLLVKAAIDRKQLPPDTLAPGDDQLEQMAQWMKEYKRLVPAASKREIRKACQTHFNIRIFRKPYKKKTHLP